MNSMSLDHYANNRVDKYKAISSLSKDTSSFIQIYRNPLLQFFPIIQLITNVQLQKQKHPQSQSRQINICITKRRQNDFNQQKQMQQIQYVQKIQNEFCFGLKWISRFQAVKQNIYSLFQQKMNSYNHNRQNCSKLLSQYNKSLTNKSTIPPFDKLFSLIQQKVNKLQKQYQNRINTSFRTKINQLTYPLMSDQKVKSIKKIRTTQFNTIIKLVAIIMAAPSIQKYVQATLIYYRQLDKLLSQSQQTTIQINFIIQNIAYKNCSFYWQNIIKCVRQTASADRCSQAIKHNIQFQTEYAGTIKTSNLKMLEEGNWLDNTITSAVIEYLKRIEGANHYHNDNNYNSCIYNHSETQSFINSKANIQDNIFQYDKLIFLVNLQNSHWFVITVFMKQQAIVVYDSLKRENKSYYQYAHKISNKINEQNYKLNTNNEKYNLKLQLVSQPKQQNTSDCGVFAIINIIVIFDKQIGQNGKYQYPLKYEPKITSEIRHSLFLFLAYLGYCKQTSTVTRRDYFDILFRSTIYHNVYSNRNSRAVL